MIPPMPPPAKHPEAMPETVGRSVSAVGADVRRSAAPNPKGIPQRSPGLRVTSYPGIVRQSLITLKGLRPTATAAQPGHNLVGVVKQRPPLLHGVPALAGQTRLHP